MEEGLGNALQIILQLGTELNIQMPTQTVSQQQMMEQVDELESIESLLDLLKFIREDRRNMLVRNP